MAELKHDKWVGTTYGNGWMHKWLIRFLKVIDVRLLYLFAFMFIVPPTMMINSKARKITYRFYRDRLDYGRFMSVWMTYKNHCAFSQVVIDKFAMYAGKKFRIEIDGFDKFQRLSEKPEGFVQLSSHVGNYEIAGYSLKADRKRFNALVFGGEKESVMVNRSKLFVEHNIRMIPMSSDMSHLFIIDKALTDGEILSMPADRVFGSQKAYSFKFIKGDGKFPQGPFMMAAMRNVPVLFVAVIKTGAKRYKITVEEIKIQETGTIKQRASNYGSQYVKLLEYTVKRHPEQWYNYFDFWGTES